MPDSVTVDTVETYETDHYGRVYVITRTMTADGVVLNTHRRPIEPDADLDAESPTVQDVAQAARTPEALARFQALPDDPDA